MIAQSLYQSLYQPQAFSLEKNDDIDINELSLYLDFALDKTLTARKGPTPTFSRGTSATRVNEAGLVQYAPENLFLNNGGAFRTSSLATKYSSNELDPDGGSSCLMVVETNVASQARTELPSSFADAYTRRRVFSWWVKPSPGVTLPAYLHLVYKDNARVSFSTATWSVATQTDGATGSIVESNGWYKLIAYLPGVTVSSPAHKLVFTDTDYYGGPLTAIRGLLVGSSQLSSGTFAWPHFQTLTNPYYAPRFDHDPVTLACKGLLIEESRTNAALRSEALVADNGWAAFGLTTAIGGTSPTESTAYEVTETAGTSTHTLVNTGGLTALTVTSVTSGLVYTGSIFLKKSTVDWVQLTLGGTGFGTTQYANFNLATGAVGNSAGMASGTTPRIEAFPNGWYRCSISVAATTTTSSTAGLVLALVDNTNSASRAPGYNGSTSNKVFAWGAQFEAGSFPTSYIPTTTAALTRSADVCSITGADFTSFYNPSEGTVSLQATSLMATATAGNRTFLSFTDGGYTNQQGIYKTVNSSNLNTPIGSGVGTAVGTITQGVAFKVAVAFQPSNSAASFNGGAAATVSSAAVVGINKLELRDPTGAPGGHPSCHIARIQYFKKRLPNAKLQSLTTP